MPLYKNELAAIRPQIVPGVRSLFTERTGGVSSGPWGGPEGIMGLNVGEHVGDNASCVRMNRDLVSQVCASTPRWMTQVHGTRVLDAEDVTDSSVEADAQTSLTPGVVCVVQVADCLPVLLAEEGARGVAAIHAGWKGLALGVIEAGVERLRERLGNPDARLVAWLGPRIGFEDFECGEDVLAYYRRRYPVLAQSERDLGGGRYRLSLAGYATYALRSVGVTHIVDCGLSTVAHPERFYSFRRDGAQSGRHAALIWIERPFEHN